MTLGNGEVAVLGIDLACTWENNGFAVLRFTTGANPRWTECSTGIRWPSTPISVEGMADFIYAFCTKNAIRAVSLDGPQGWRAPRTPANTPGVGRRCEYESRTPGKTGTYGNTYPRTWLKWVTFSIDVFAALLQKHDNAQLVNDREARRITEPRPEILYVVECFPTDCWRTSQLAALPGHRNATEAIVRTFAQRLRETYGLPETIITSHHDNLQAVVSALPAAALLGGPAVAIPRGIPGWIETEHPDTSAPTHRVEGIIWNSCPMAGAREHRESTLMAPPSSDAKPAAGNGGINDETNPILPDDRDPASDQIVNRGVELFRHLVEVAGQGESVGIGYAGFVAYLYGVQSFAGVAGRRYLPSDAEFVIRLAMLITDSAGGRVALTKNGQTIQAGMDTFIWNSQSPFDRPAKAWQSRWCMPPYTRDVWLLVFPNGTRRLFNNEIATDGEPS